jgi:steroid 5-alpha reductase family enzyme
VAVVSSVSMRHKAYIDASKGLTPVVVLALILAFHATDDVRAWIYLATHGTYGVLWVTKSMVFPDKQWEQRVSVAYGALTFLALGVFWVSPWLIVAHQTATPPAWWLGLCVAMYSFGVFLHFASDMQKHLHLAARPGVLLTDGLWARVRNPNYLGELLIYAGFSLVAYHWLPMAWLAAMVAGVWVPNMLRKDRSLARYPEFAAWKARSKMIIPFVV